MSVFALQANIFYKYVFILMEYGVFDKNVFSYFMKMCIHANPIFWVPFSCGKVDKVLRPLPNR